MPGHGRAGSLAVHFSCVRSRGCANRKGYADRKGYANGHHLISPCCEVSISFPSPPLSNTVSI
jgi:hypothetical protein